MPDDQAKRFFEFLLAEDAETIDCQSVLDAVHRYVDLEVEGRQADVLMPGVAAHLTGCSSCGDMYEAVAELAKREAKGELPELGELWSQLSVIGQPGGRAVAGQLIAASTSPQRVVPAPTRADLDAALGKSSTASQTRGGKWRSDPATWALAIAACLSVALGIGWWRADEGADRTADVLALTGAASEVSQTHTQDGAWAKVFFQPNDDSAVVHVGDMPRLRSGERLECWLRKRAGGTEDVAALADLDSDSGWWLIDAVQPMKDYVAMIVKVAGGTEPQSLMEVPLEASR
jgi:hypothetical protein